MGCVGVSVECVKGIRMIVIRRVCLYIHFPSHSSLFVDLFFDYSFFLSYYVFISICVCVFCLFISLLCYLWSSNIFFLSYNFTFDRLGDSGTPNYHSTQV